MGWKQRVFLTSSQVYVCKNCKTHLTTKEDVISKVCKATTDSHQDFNGRLGQANLVNQVFNLEEGILKERQMRTGKHVVRDVYCSRCRTYVGWKYVCIRV